MKLRTIVVDKPKTKNTIRLCRNLINISKSLDMEMHTPNFIKIAIDPEECVIAVSGCEPTELGALEVKRYGNNGQVACHVTDVIRELVKNGCQLRKTYFVTGQVNEWHVAHYGEEKNND